MEREVRVSDKLTIKIDDEFLNDMEIIDMLSDMSTDDSKTVMLFPKYMRKVYGAEQVSKIYDSLRDEKGRVPIQKVIEINNFVIESIGKKKQ